MKRKVKTALIIVAALAMLLSACTIVVGPTGTEWSLYYTWQGSSEQYAVWTLYSDGTFVDNYGGTGYWEVQNSLFQLSYNNYTYFGTVYTGNIYSSSYMSGNMQGTDAYGFTHNGTWYAYRGVRGNKSLTPSASGGLTPSGDPIE
jgi:hypothetical protein